MPVVPRRFALFRQADPSGVSGTGVVAFGVQFEDGHVALRWTSHHPATSVWASLADVLAVHGHDGATTVYWIDAPGVPHPRFAFEANGAAPAEAGEETPNAYHGRHRA
jgi:hypothetical protein